MHKTLLLTLATCALLKLAPAAYASPNSAKRRAAQIAWTDPSNEARPCPCPWKVKPAPSNIDEEHGALFRSWEERTMINPG